MQATHTGFEPVISAVTGQRPLLTGPMGRFFNMNAESIFIHSTTQKSALRESNSPVQIGNLVPKPIGQEHKQSDSVFKFRISLQSVQWESNPHFRLGKAVGLPLHHGR